MIMRFAVCEKLCIYVDMINDLLIQWGPNKVYDFALPLSRYIIIIGFGVGGIPFVFVPLPQKKPRTRDKLHENENCGAIKCFGAKLCGKTATEQNNDSQ